MNIQLSHSKSSLIELAQIAQTNNLCVPGWFMSKLYADWISCPLMIMANDRIAIGYINDMAIGCATYTVQSDQVMVYVKPEHRRNGYGTQLVNTVTNNCDTFTHNTGLLETDKFWDQYNNRRDT